MKNKRSHLGNGKKETRKSFYSATVAALVCTMVVGAVYYETRQDAGKASQGEQTGQQASVAGESALEDGEWIAGDVESKAASTISNAGTTTSANHKEKVGKASDQKEIQVKSNQKKEKTADSNTKTKKATYVFQEEKGLTWPVKGDVLMKFSENNTIFFKTLAQYKCNPAIEISAQQGTKVIASAAGVVTAVSQDDVTGTMVTTDIGSGYTITYGQLENLKVKKGDEVKEGQLLGVVANPTKYFSEEGSNLYFQVKENGTALDPLLLLN